MAEGSELERTQPASPRRLEQARERGEVPRSADWSAFAVLIVAAGGLALLGAALAATLASVMRAGLILDAAVALELSEMSGRLYDSGRIVLGALFPVLLAIVVVAVLAPMFPAGWLFTLTPLLPDLARLDPLAGLRRMLSWDGLFELLKSLLAVVIVGAAAAAVLWRYRMDILGLAREPVAPAVVHAIQLVGIGFVAAAGALLVIASMDLLWQLWAHARRLRMSPDEVRQELRESEGDPRVKARARRFHRELAQRRAVADVPRADVVVTNPTHFAIALQRAQGGAPRVVAKGSLTLAQAILDAAERAGTPVVAAAALARTLFAVADVGDSVPAPLHRAVSEVFAWVYQARRNRALGVTRAAPLPVRMD